MKANKLKDLIQKLNNGDYNLVKDEILSDKDCSLDNDTIKFMLTNLINRLKFVRKSNDIDYIMLKYEVFKNNFYGAFTVITNENVDFVKVYYTVCTSI